MFVQSETHQEALALELTQQSNLITVGVNHTHVITVSHHQVIVVYHIFTLAHQVGRFLNATLASNSC